jgi:hypothetical protein
LSDQRAGRRGQHDAEGDLATFDIKFADHVQRDQVFVKLRLLYFAERRKDLFFSRLICHVSILPIK